MNARLLYASLDTPVALTGDTRVERVTFWQRVHGLAAAIDAQRAQRWALVCEDSSWFAAGLFALAKARRNVVLPQAPQAGSLTASGAQIDAVLTDSPERFAGFTTLSTTDIPLSENATAFMPDDHVLVETYTSGSSGAPKCVAKEFGQLRREIGALEREWHARLDGDAVVIGTVPHYHLYGLLVRILWPLLTGRPFQTRVSLHASELRAAATASRNIIVSSPAFLSRVTDCRELPAPECIAAVFSSGAPLPDASAALLQREWGHAPIEIYGSTETGGIAWRAWAGADERPYWRPINGVAIDLREESAGKRLWVKSEFTWQSDWMATGDLARLHSDGRFVLLGRADDVVKFEDKRLSLSEMRSRLIVHPWVQDARLLLVPGRRTVIGAVVVLTPQGQQVLTDSGKLAVRDALQTLLRQSYETILIPRKWRFLESLPDNDMGKIERARLLQLFEQSE